MVIATLRRAWPLGLNVALTLTPALALAQGEAQTDPAAPAPSVAPAPDVAPAPEPVPAPAPPETSTQEPRAGAPTASAAPSPTVDAGNPATVAPKHKKKHKHDPPENAAPGEPIPKTRPGYTTPFGRLEPTGRIFVRGALSSHHEAVIDAAGATHEERIDSFDVSIPSARVGLYYHAPLRWLTANVEAELTKKPELKDAWLKARFRYLTAKAGQFKMPFSNIESESIWDLPVAQRGLLHTALVKDLQVAGRRPGVTLEARGHGKIRPSLVVGGFQGSVLTDDDPDKRKVELLSEQGMSSQSWVARAELRVDDFVFGAEYEDRLGTPALLVTKYYQTGGLDMTLDTELGRVGLRIWVEGILGQSWLENWYKPPDGRDATFAFARVISAVRLLGRHRGELYVEPYGMFGLLDPDRDVTQDLASAEVLGVNVGAWKIVRVGLEGELERVERNFPQTYYLGSNPDRAALVLQAGAQF
ncbi:MAG TPA: hypothetical protein VGQ57_05160 [Polyangiaceae bacterium]|nr:hypothetical protein [Polyangiaceae bacterium]